MQQPLSRRQHGFTDWSYVPTVAAAPALAKFSGDQTPARLARALSGAILASALFTRAEWGAVKVLPYKAHLAMGVTGILAGTLSRAPEMGEPDAHDPRGVH